MRRYLPLTVRRTLKEFEKLTGSSFENVGYKFPVYRQNTILHTQPCPNSRGRLRIRDVDYWIVCKDVVPKHLDAYCIVISGEGLNGEDTYYVFYRDLRNSHVTRPVNFSFPIVVYGRLGTLYNSKDHIK